MKKLLPVFVFILMLPLFSYGQTCPTLYNRNNGNNAPTDCPGAGGTTAEASGISGTPYTYSTCCGSLTKTGGFFMKWTSATSPSYVPAIKNVYIDGVIASTIMGPPSAFDSTTTSGHKAIRYCFYTVNLPNASKFAVEFVHPSTGASFKTCSYTWSGSSDIAPTTPPTITSHPVAATRCTGTSVTFAVTATPATGGNALTYQWRKNSVAISGATNATYTIASVVSGDAGLYSAAVTEAVSLAVESSTEAQLTVNAGATPSVSNFTSPSATSVCASAASTVTVNSTSIGTGTFTVTYNVSGANSSTGNTATLTMGASNGTFSIPGSLLTATGTNTVTITGVSNGSCGATVSSSNTASFNTTSTPTGATASASATTLCSGSVLTLTGAATGATSWSWIGPGSFTSTLQSPTRTVSATSGGVYTLVASNTCGSATQAVTASVTVYSSVPTTVSASASSTSLCSGATLTLTGAATNATAWSWTGPASFTSALQSPTRTMSATTGGVYTLVASNVCGSATQAVTSSVAVYTGTPTSATASASSTSLCSGATLTLTGGATNANAWSWTGPSGFTSALQSPTRTMSATTGGVYTLVASNACGNASQAVTSSVTVYTGTPTSATASASSTSLCSGATLTLTGGATNSSAWSWTGPSGFTSALQSPTHTVGATSGGVYTLVASNACGNASQAVTSAVSVTTGVPSSATAVASATSICAGSTLNLTGSATGATSWSWTGPNSFTSALQNPSLTASAASAGVYTLVASNVCGNATAATTSAVDVTTGVPSFVTAFASATSICAGSTLNLTGSAAGATDWLWTGPNGFTSTVLNESLTVSAASAGIYSLVASNVCGNATAATTSAVSVTTGVPTSATAVASATSVCAGSTLNLTGSATGATAWSWTGPNSFTSTLQNPSLTASAASAGIYSLVASNVCGNATVATTSAVSVTTAVPSSVTATASETTMCSGATLNLTGNATGATAWSWTGPNSFTSTLQNPSLTVSAASSGVYSLVASNVCGSATQATTATVTVSAGAGVPTSVTASASATSICAGSTLNLTGSATNATSWSWAGPNSFTSTLQNPSLTVSAASAGVYTLVANNSCGSAAAATTSAVSVTTGVPTSATAVASATAICAGSTLNLTSSATGATSWSWTGPNSFTSALQNPSLTASAASAGVYTLVA
ncbi:MAG: hypothetical protein V4649_18275, partial [Bacteroidota bacterium]